MPHLVISSNLWSRMMSRQHMLPKKADVVCPFQWGTELSSYHRPGVKCSKLLIVGLYKPACDDLNHAQMDLLKRPREAVTTRPNKS